MRLLAKSVTSHLFRRLPSRVHLHFFGISLQTTFAKFSLSKTERLSAGAMFFLSLEMPALMLEHWAWGLSRPLAIAASARVF